MDAKILKAIADSLPETQVKMIKDALIERDNLKSELADIKEEADRLRGWWKDSIAKLDRFAEQNDQLRAQVEKLTTLNTELMAKDIKNEIAVVKAELNGVNNTVDKFLRNTVYRESLQHQVADEYTSVQNVYQPNGQYQSVPTPSKTHRDVTDKRERTTE